MLKRNCSDSFQDPNVWTPVRRRLKKSAVPSRLLPVRKHDQPNKLRLLCSVTRASRASSRSASSRFAVKVRKGLLDNLRSIFISSHEQTRLTKLFVTEYCAEFRLNVAEVLLCSPHVFFLHEHNESRLSESALFRLFASTF